MDPGQIPWDSCDSRIGRASLKFRLEGARRRYRERIAVPPTAQLLVQIRDVSRADAPAPLIGEQRIEMSHQVPVSFEVHYDPDVIDPRRRYQVSARIVDGQQLLFITDTAYPVITGWPNQVDLLLRRVPPSVPPTPSAGSGSARPDAGR